MTPDRLGPYHVLDLLGRGGMGVVYLATDPRLHRQVAVKVLPLSIGHDPARLARFEREARTLAGLSHPNLCAVYGLDEEPDGRRLLVMEYVPGPTLGERVMGGQPMTMAEALDACRQIAAGLEAAHERGVVHRDLKPANVKIRPDGVVKVLDFGLAKTSKPVWASATDEEEATDDPHATAEGRILGTVGYMSPEQARGRPVDRRTDIWALGCVLFECLTGGRAFRGQTPTDMAVAILEREPVWDELPPRLPARVRTLLKRCLEKDEQRRLRDIGDARLELEDALSELRGRAPSPSTSSGASPPRLPSGSHNLPESITSFAGRERELAEVRAALERARLVTLTGAGGCGKTRVAIEAAREAGPGFPDGVWLVELSQAGEGPRVGDAIARALGVRIEDHATVVQTLADALAQKTMLLVLDGCEAVPEQARQVAERLLRASPGLRVLVTTRVVLGASGETSLSIGPLPVPETGRPGSAESMAHIDSVRLFMDRAAAVAPTFELTDANAAAVAEVCRLVDGLPLAIELAAARVRLLAPGQIAERLADRLRLIRSGRATGGDTLWAALEWSWDQLDPTAQAVLRRLAIFKGGWTLAAAETLAAGEGVEDWEVLDLLGQLVDRSLVVVEERDGDPRYRLLETVRQHALERLEASGELDRMRDRHLALMIKLARQAEPQLTGKRQKTWFTRLEREQENIREALAHALGAGRLDEGVELAGCVWRWWFFRGHTAEARRTMRALFDRATDAGAGGLGLARLCTGLGWIEAEVGAVDSALAAAERGLAEARAARDPRTTSNVLNTLGHIHSDIRQDYGAARAAYEESLQLRRELGEQVLIAGSLNNIAEVYRKQGDRARARAMYEEAITINRALDNRSWESINLENLAWLLLEEGTLDEALHAVRRAMAIDQELGAHGHQLNLLEAMASISVARGETELAARLFGCIEAERESRATPPSPGELAEYQRWLDALRERLPLDRLSREWSAGRAMTFSQVVRHAIEMTSE